jgi:hypothetical protein
VQRLVLFVVFFVLVHKVLCPASMSQPRNGFGL